MKKPLYKKSLFHVQVKSLLEETENAYRSYSTVNADYAVFASLALRDFRRALGRPEMSRSELEMLIRAALRKNKSNADGLQWTDLIASYMEHDCARGNSANDDRMPVEDCVMNN